MKLTLKHGEIEILKYEFDIEMYGEIGSIKIYIEILKNGYTEI